MIENLEQIENFSFTEKDWSRTLHIKDQIQASIQSLTKVQGKEEERQKQKVSLETELREIQSSQKSIELQSQSIITQLESA